MKQLLISIMVQVGLLGACVPVPEPVTPSVPTAPPATASPPTRVPTQVVVPTPRAPVPTVVPNEVAILDDIYSPSEITIRVGETVTWRNYGGKVHDAVSLTGTWTPALLQPGGRSRATFPTRGRFEYTCTVHPSMTGWVVVQ